MYRAGLPAGLAWAGPPLWARRRPLAIEGDAYQSCVECLCFVWNCQQPPYRFSVYFGSRLEPVSDGFLRLQTCVPVLYRGLIPVVFGSLVYLNRTALLAVALPVVYSNGSTIPLAFSLFHACLGSWYAFVSCVITSTSDVCTYTCSGS